MWVFVWVARVFSLLKFYEETRSLRLIRTIWRHKCLISASSLRLRQTHGVCGHTFTSHMWRVNGHPRTGGDGKQGAAAKWRRMFQQSTGSLFSVSLQICWSPENRGWLQFKKLRFLPYFHLYQNIQSVFHSVYHIKVEHWLPRGIYAIKVQTCWNLVYCI